MWHGELIKGWFKGAVMLFRGAVKDGFFFLVLAFRACVQVGFTNWKRCAAFLILMGLVIII